MRDQLTFIESQRFTQWWLWVILLGIGGLVAWGTFQQLVLGQPFGDNPMPNAPLVMLLVGVVGISIFIFLFRLDTHINEQGIVVRVFPFHVRDKKFLWKQIKRCEVRQYAPLIEYGGWGIRYGFMGRGKAYNIKGNMGLQLVFQDGKRLLIGTQKPEQLQQVLALLRQNMPDSDTVFK